MKLLLYIVLISLIFTGCTKGYVDPITSNSTIKTDSLKSSVVNTKAVPTQSSSTDTDTSNPDYWYNGTTGTALIQVTCSDCTALATIGTETIPFMFNAQGLGVLRYTPVSGLPIKIAVCPTGNKSVKAEVLGSNGTSLYSYSGVINSNWNAVYIIK